ncbi:peptidase M13 family protein [Parvularcula bermudensis HTCC2503]|uniref:Peptidase M13 family protein n=1 Tax=Parvularcula bermudensis (strain ATCC BAA-594 / HTCC2503 / KCTC 12087) TaxID=314260 RepID=E0TBZ2_PARBH|nr:M13-type metalloendopeptidase [Parvularcula bermudensis]ADM08485.1 peptidase M13 family protein [Parvularcula bermudensis HTCC2503]
MVRRHSSLMLSSLLVLAACGGESSQEPQVPIATDEALSMTPEGTSAPDMVTPSAGQPDGPELGAWGIDLTAMDVSVDPGDDFFRYVNGSWLEGFEIPAEFSNYGAFTVLFERSEARVRDIIESAAATESEAGSISQKIGDYFASFVDRDGIDAKGLAPIAGQIETYAALEDHADIAAAFADIDAGSNSPFVFYVDVDNKQPDRYIVYLTQSGLGLPNKDYYVKDEFAEQREAYQDFLVQMVATADRALAENGLGVTVTEGDVADRAAAVYALEEKLADAHWDPAKRRNADLTYNLYTLAELGDYAPGFPWSDSFDIAGIGQQDEFVVRENDAIKASAAIFADTPVAVWADYLAVHALIENADVLPSDVDAQVFDFYGRTLSGTPEQRARWKRGVQAVNGAMGEAVGQIYVERYFPPESKAQMQQLVENLKTAFSQRLDALDWMGEATKDEARAKLASFTTKIGYPDKWTDYEALEIKPGDAFGNARRAQRFEFEEMIGKLGQPIDKTEWFMTPQTVNAYYSRNRNEIVFPAAILQAPFFDPHADPAVNYGGIGAVIGHEIGHGFDDQGRKADGTGLQRDWWTEEDAARFDALAEKLGKQYGGYSPLNGHFINAELTMGENIGDLGGVTMAYDAYRLSLNGEEPEVLDGFTGDQRFFMAWGQVWKRKYREDELKRRLVTDPHSPSEYRTNGVVRNMTPWYEAFTVTEEDDLFLPVDQRVEIW